MYRLQLFSLGLLAVAAAVATDQEAKCTNTDAAGMEELDETAHIQVASKRDQAQREEIIQVKCNKYGDKANDCESCPRGADKCNSLECEWVVESRVSGCTDRLPTPVNPIAPTPAVAPPVNPIAPTPAVAPTPAPVHMYNCGGHYAPSCELCIKNGEEYMGSSWCHGDCEWQVKGSKCILPASTYSR